MRNAPVEPVAATYGAAWRRIRAQVLAEEPYCSGYPSGHHCGALVRTTSVDHIDPVVEGGTSDRTNLQGLCGSCNSRKGQAEARQRPRTVPRPRDAGHRSPRVWREV